METVGQATWSHTLKSLRPGGTVVVSGATSGPAPSADLARVFFLQLRIQGSTMGTRAELRQLAEFLDVTGKRPLIDSEIPMENAREGLARIVDGDVFGKIVLTR